MRRYTRYVIHRAFTTNTMIVSETHWEYWYEQGLRSVNMPLFTNKRVPEERAVVTLIQRESNSNALLCECIYICICGRMYEYMWNMYIHCVDVDSNRESSINAALYQ